MKQVLLAIFLSISPFLCLINRVHAEESRTNTEKPAKNVKISSEDRQVIQMMELLEKMDLLEDMELLEGQKMAGTEDQK